LERLFFLRIPKYNPTKPRTAIVEGSGAPGAGKACALGTIEMAEPPIGMLMGRLIRTSKKIVTDVTRINTLAFFVIHFSLLEILIGVIGYRLLPPGRKLIKKRWIVKGKQPTRDIFHS
jgi:hypothetical protein